MGRQAGFAAAEGGDPDRHRRGRVRAAHRHRTRTRSLRALAGRRRSPDRRVYLVNHGLCLEASRAQTLTRPVRSLSEVHDHRRGSAPSTRESASTGVGRPARRREYWPCNSVRNGRPGRDRGRARDAATYGSLRRSPAATLQSWRDCAGWAPPRPRAGGDVELTADCALVSRGHASAWPHPPRCTPRTRPSWKTSSTKSFGRLAGRPEWSAARPDISEGTLSASLGHPREVFKPAIVESAAAYPLAQPSERRSAPSREDVRLTRQLVECGHLLTFACTIMSSWTDQLR